MPVNVYDNTGHQFVFGENFSLDAINHPLVTENRTKYSFPFGDAELVQIAFSGIYIVYGDIVMREAKTLYFNMSDQGDLIELHFTLAGTGHMRNEHTGSSYDFKENQYNMHYIPYFIGRGDYRKDLKYKFFEVHFSSPFFMELAEESSPVLIDFADKITSDNHAELINPSLPITFPMHQCIREIMNCNLKGGLKLLFLQSKCIELLALQAQAYEEYNDKASILRCTYDTEQIHFAKDYLLQHADQPPSLTELARIAGINEFKLKKGFREIFNTSVFGYLNDYRLHEAKQLLYSGNTIKEVADRFGFSSVQHFSKAFKQRFGIPPGQCKPKQTLF